MKKLNLTPIQLTPAKKPNRRKQKFLDASSLPLITLMNARSLYNKNINFKKFMNELGFEAAIISETWEREDNTLENLLQMSNYKIHSYKRTKVKANRQPGGACIVKWNEVLCEPDINKKVQHFQTQFVQN